MQKEITIFSQIKAPTNVPVDEVAKCRTWRDAFWVGFKNSKSVTELQQVAEAIGKTQGYVSQIMKEGCRKNFNPDQIHDIQILFGNKAIAQFQIMRLDGSLYSQSKQAKRQHLLDELAALDSQEVA